MSEESKNGIYDQSSIDAIKPDLMTQYQNIPRRPWKIETTHRGVATHSLRTTALKNASKSTLVAHKNTKKHYSNFEVVESTMNISQFVSKKKSSDSEKIANAEMLFAGYFSEHRIPFSNVEHLFGICKRAFPDSDIAKKVSCKRTKLSYTTQDGIAHYENLELNEICHTQKFSAIIDESTDASITQVLAIVLRYFDLKKLGVTDALLDTVVVENGSTVSLFNLFKHLFEERNIPITNIVGFGSDNCSTMFGKKNGFQKLLKRYFTISFCIRVRLPFICSLFKSCCVSVATVSRIIT